MPVDNVLSAAIHKEILLSLSLITHCKPLRGNNEFIQIVSIQTISTLRINQNKNNLRHKFTHGFQRNNICDLPRRAGQHR